MRSFVSGIKSAKAIQWVWHLLVPFLFVSVVLLFFHTRGRFEFDTDEGINLIKALLVEKGYPLYSKVWSDQPPLLTYLLALGIHFFGYRVEVARNIVFLLSLGLLWAAFEFVQLNWKRSYAYAGCLLIFLLPKYLVLSLSVMVGLPSISLAMISLLFLALWHKKRRYFWLIFSAIFMSLSTLTKLMIGFLVPIFVIGILVAEYIRFLSTSNWRNLFLPAAVWSAIFVAIFLGTLAVAIGPTNISQLLENHLDMTKIQYYENPQFTINFHLKESWPFLFLAIPGTIFAVRSRRWEILYLAAWLITAYILLLFYQPVWYHHQLYVTIPAAILGGIAVVEGVDLCLQVVRKHYNPDSMGWVRVLSLVGTLFAVFLFVRAPEPITVLSGPPSLKTAGLGLGGKTEKIYLSMHDFAPQTHWVVTDLPMFAFRAGLPVPPEIAVITEKRLYTGHLTEAQILDALIEYQPEQVLFGRFILPGLDDYLETNYSLVLSRNNLRLYIRNDLLHSQ